jgi:hypothetical protein
MHEQPVAAFAIVNRQVYTVEKFEDQFAPSHCTRAEAEWANDNGQVGGTNLLSTKERTQGCIGNNCPHRELARGEYFVGLGRVILLPPRGIPRAEDSGWGCGNRKVNQVGEVRSIAAHRVFFAVHGVAYPHAAGRVFGSSQATRCLCFGRSVLPHVDRKFVRRVFDSPDQASLIVGR